MMSLALQLCTGSVSDFQFGWNWNWNWIKERTWRCLELLLEFSLHFFYFVVKTLFKMIELLFFFGQDCGTLLLFEVFLARCSLINYL